MADNAQPADVGTTVPVRMPDGTVVAMPTHPTPEQYQKIADLQAHFNPPKELTDTLASDMATQEQETNAGPAPHVEAPTAEEIHTAQTQPDLYNPKWAENYLATGVKSGKLYEKALAVREADAQRELQQQANLVPQAAAPTVENSAKLNQPVQLATHIEDWQPTPEATPGTVIGSLIDSAGLEAYKIWNGMMLNHLDSKKVGDITSAFPRSQQEIAADEQKTAELKSNIAEAENIQANSTPFFNNKTGETMYGVARGFTDYAPEMGAFMIDPALGVTAMAGAAGFGGYGKYRARGATPEQAALGGTLEGSIMAATSALPMGYITKNIGKTGIEQFTGSMIERGIAPLTAQSVAMSAVDTGIANPDKTWGQWAGELPDTIKQAALSALIFTGAASTLHAGVRGITKGFGIADLNQTKVQQATTIDNITDPAKNVDQAINAAQQELNKGPSVADQLRAIRPLGEDHGATGLSGAIKGAPGGAGVGGADTEGSVANAVLGAERSVSAGRVYANLRAGAGTTGAEQGAPEVQPVAGETAGLQAVSPMGPEARAVPENTLEQRQSQEDRDRFDTLYTNAVNLVAKNGSASVPLLQRNLVVPWGRAERIIQKMQDDGIVGEPNINGQRPILQMPSWVTETAIQRPVIEKGAPRQITQIIRGEQNASEKPSTTQVGEQPSRAGGVGRTGPEGMERGQPGAESAGALPIEAATNEAERIAGAGEHPGAREVSQLTPKQQALLDQEQAALRQGKGINAIPEQYALEEHPRATPDFSIGRVALERAKTAAVRADIAINRALGGEPEETLSARAEREKEVSPVARAGRAVLNAAIPGHTERALQATAERRRAAGLQFSVGQEERGIKPGDHVVNIGLNTNDGGTITADQAKKVLATAGVRITDSAVHVSNTEPTLVAKLDRALSPKEAHDISSKLRQDAIAQFSNGAGKLYGPQAAKWGEFNPDYFLGLNGRPLSEDRAAPVSVEGTHFSNAPRETLSGQFYGTGLKGAEARRLAESTDPRLKNRLAFYVNEGHGVRPEAGVGAIKHTVRLNNLYDIGANPLRLPSDNLNDLESAILDHGYSGYYLRDWRMNQGAAVLLGDAAKAVHPETISGAGRNTINVDGIHRPALNSDGKPIHPTTEGTKNFWRWFGNSKVVDEQGRPQVMYHGTAANIEEFKPRQANAIFTTPDKETANEFTVRAGHENEPSGNVMPIYVRAEHPFDPDNADDIAALRNAIGNKFPKYKGNEFSGSIDDVAQGRWMALENPIVQQYIKAHHDGFYVYEQGQKNLAVYDPAQIKSAIGNVGAFSRERPQIQFSVTNTDGEETMYSPLLKAVREMKMNSATPEQWKATLKGLTLKGIKPEEMEHTGVMKYLDEGIKRYENKPISRSDLESYIKKNQVLVTPKVYGYGAEGSNVASIDFDAGNWETEEPDMDWLRESAMDRAYGMDDDELKDYLDLHDITDENGGEPSAEIREKLLARFATIGKRNSESAEPEIEAMANNVIDKMADDAYNDYYNSGDSPQIRRIDVTAGDRDFTFYDRIGYGERELYSVDSEDTVDLGRRADRLDDADIEGAIRSYLAENYNLYEAEEDARPKFENFTLPGGDNYRERLLTNANHKGEAFEYRNHFEDENTIAHTRVDDRETPIENIEKDFPDLAARLRAEGKTKAKIYFLEELQSDWAQQGREKTTQTVPYKPEELHIDEEHERQSQEELSHLHVVPVHDAQDATYTKDHGLVTNPDHIYWMVEDDRPGAFNGGPPYADKAEAEKYRQYKADANIWVVHADDGQRFEILKHNQATREDAIRYIAVNKEHAVPSGMNAFETYRHNEELERQEKKYNWIIDDFKAKNEPSEKAEDWPNEAAYNEAREKYLEQLVTLKMERAALRKRISGEISPGAYVESTDAWVSLAMKDAISEAVRGGYDLVSWTTGDQQTMRWSHGLRQRVDTIAWEKSKDGFIHIRAMQGNYERANTRYGENDLSAAIGKTMAGRIIKDPNQSGEIKGDDIVVADLGMTKFYGNSHGDNPDGKPAIMTKVANQVLKKLGGDRVKEADIGNAVKISAKIRAVPTSDDMHVTYQPTFEITPKMREEVMKGLPQFSRKTTEQQRIAQSPEEAMATLPAGMRKAAQLMTERANNGKGGGLVIGNEEQNMRKAAEMLAAKHGTTVPHEWGILEAAMRSGEAAGEKPVDLRERRDLFMRLPSEARQRLTEELSATKREGGHNVDAYQVDLDMLSDMLEDEGKNLKTYPAYHNFTYEGMPVTSEFTTKPKINGFYHPDIGTVFVNLDKVTPEEFKGVVAHEVNHAANNDALNAEVMKRLEGATGDDIYGRVNARLERAGQSGNPREATSYLLEEAMNMGRTAGHSRLDQGFFGWAQKALPDFVVNTLKKWVAAVRAALYRSGIFIKANDLTVDDFVAINQASMRALARGELEPAQAEAAQPSIAGKPTEQAEQHIGKMSALMGKLKDAADAIADDFKMAVAPMAAGKTDAYRAIAKDYANAERIARWQWAKFDEVLKKNYTEDQLKEMWDAADEQNVLLQQGLPTAGKGLDRLTPAQRETMDVLHQYGESLLQRAKDTGMFKGEGLPYWTPRIAAVIGEDGEYMRPTTGAGGAKEGRNVTVSSPNLKQRKYLTAAETEEAMKAKFGESAQIVRNIRAMPMAMERLERAVAGRELINQIKQLGTKVGEDLVSTNAGNGYFTLDHPAFKTYRPRMVEVDGKMTPAEDQNGNMIFDKVPLYMRDDLKGPIKAILSQPGGKIYNALMSLKGRAMSVIMYSPLIHNAVEFGRALPIMPGKMLTFRMYFDGNKAKNDPVQMRQAIADGMVPIGHRGGFQDISGMMEGATIQAGRSLTAKAIGGGIGLLNKAAGEATKRGIDTFGDLWHNTLLWDRVGDLQMGLYVNLKRLQTEKLIKQGLSQEAAEGTAGKIAAHMANRYAGALPNEAMSAMTRKLTNLALFSRSFTMGNLGVMKDIATGLPKDVQAQIVRDYGELALRTGKDIARRKALAAFVMDIGLMYAMTSLTQDAFDMLKRDKSLSAVEHGYADRLSTLLNKAEKNPLAVLNSPLDSLQSLSSTSANEPGKEDRVLYGYDKSGTAIYIRLPTGKIGEEFIGWATSPLDMLKRKESTFLRPIDQTLHNDLGFGRRVYNPDDPGVAGAIRNVGKIVSNAMLQQVPNESIQAMIRGAQGTGTDMDAYKVLGPLFGLTFSRGAPGGPAVGEMFKASQERRAMIADNMPDIRQMILAGKQDQAVQKMIDIGMTQAEIKLTLTHVLNPAARLTPGALKRFEKTATDEQKEKMRQLQSH